mmetsp:Transcript_69691/g.215466  ORF Transcript_69691/g.215466 Transcript_69691/m.215466 type:complete len:176 (-) Transcript_69691:92-619(-)
MLTMSLWAPPPVPPATLADLASNSSGHRGQIVTVYHQTSHSAAMSILRNGFHKGTHGICGAAIYFADKRELTDIKIVGGYGFMIEAKVDLGRVKRMGKFCDHHMTGEKLAQMGYDSIRVDRSHWYECRGFDNCGEVIIYSKDRVVSMKGYPWMWNHAHGYRYGNTIYSHVHGSAR